MYTVKLPIDRSEPANRGAVGWAQVAQEAFLLVGVLLHPPQAIAAGLSPSDGNRGRTTCLVALDARQVALVGGKQLGELWKGEVRLKAHPPQVPGVERHGDHYFALDVCVSRKVDLFAMDATDPIPNLRTLREERLLKASDVADAIGVDRGHLSRVERGRATPSISLLVAVADRYALTDADLGRLLRSLVPEAAAAMPGEAQS